MRSWAIRRLRKNGQSLYLAIPRIARLQLGVYVDDPMVIEFDDERRVLLVYPQADVDKRIDNAGHFGDLKPVLETVVADPDAAVPAVHRVRRPREPRT